MLISGKVFEGQWNHRSQMRDLGHPAFGVKMDTLMRIASAYEIAETRKREGLIRVKRVLTAA